MQQHLLSSFLSFLKTNIPKLQFLFFIFSIFLLSPNVNAQVSKKDVNSIKINKSIESFQISQSESANLDRPLNTIEYIKPNETAQNRTAQSLDTIQWNLAKASALQQLSLNNSTSASALAQYFDAPGSVQVQGANFYGYKVDATGGTNINISVELFLAGSDSLPTGSALATKVVSLGQFPPAATSLADLIIKVEFDSPVSTSQPYLIIVRNNSPNSINLYSSDFTAQDGGEEWLGSLLIGTTWLRSYDINVGGEVFDADFFIEPYVSYDISADFSLTPEENPGDNMVEVASNSSSDAFLENRMYNFAAAIGQSEDSYEFDFGDGSATVSGSSAMYTFANGDAQDISLEVTLFGWFADYTDAVTKTWASSTLGINDNLSLSELKLIPNPATTQVEISNFDTNNIEKVEVFDVLGKKVLETKVNIIETSSWKSGLYLVRISGQDMQVVKRLVIL